MKVTSTDKLNDAFKEKEKKCREWTTQETQEKKVAMAVMVLLIISRQGAIHRDSDALETLRSRHQRRLGEDGPERPTLQRGDYGENLQQGQQGLR